ncbi:MAG: hypothetical protein ABI140_21900 [Jatrophihabitantaceae bacterium]
MDFARSLTARPWEVGPADIGRLSAVGFSRPSIVLVIGLVAMFNYLTRIADGTGIEADYGAELPRFVYRGVMESALRPEPAQWPPVDDSIQLVSELTGVYEAWCRWREYVLESPAPISPAMRNQLRRIAARNACDSSVDLADNADSTDAWSTPGSTQALSDLAEKLSRTPWLVTSSDVDALRSAGLNDLSILHVIAVVAYQSAESRLRIGLSALARSGE